MAGSAPTDAAPHTPNDPHAGTRKTHRQRGDYTYLHSAIDGNTRLAYTKASEDDTTATAIDFTNNAHRFFATHEITRIERVITDNHTHTT